MRRGFWYTFGCWGPLKGDSPEMVEEIGGPAHGDLDRLARSGRAKTHPTDGSAAAPVGANEPESVLPTELRELIERVKSAETFRKDRVHQVLEKLERDELVTSETVREAAEKLLREGL